MSTDENRFLFPPPPSWTVGETQKILGTELTIYDPVTPQWDEFPPQVEWNLTSNRVFLFGPNTKFRIHGTFQKQTDGAGNWVPMVDADKTAVMLIPNWWDHLTEEIAVYPGNSRIQTSDEGRHVWPYLNAFLYSHMDKMSKKLLCPHPTSPGHCVPTGNNAYTHTSNEWLDYGTRVFNGLEFSFDHTPLHMFPVYQNAEYLVNGNFPCALPMPVLGRLDIRLTFGRNQSGIFRKLAPVTNTTNYRFFLEKIQLCVEEARLSPTFEKNFLKSNRTFYYPGVTKLMLAETITATSMFHKTRFMDVACPEGIFIFALHKDVIGGTAQYQLTNADNKVFRPLNLRDVALTFANETYAQREPNFGMLENDFVEVKQLLDHLVSPPFGMPMDPDKLTLDLVRNCAANSAFPHAYINLCNFAAKTRITPVNKGGEIVVNRSNLDINLKFKTGGATADVTYFIYIFYTDVNQMLDMKTKQFSSPYLKN